MDEPPPGFASKSSIFDPLEVCPWRRICVSCITMNTRTPSDPPLNRDNEESLQRTFEAMLSEIKKMKIDPDEQKRLIGMLIKYRTAWNSYINRIKPRKSSSEMSNRIIKQSGRP